MLITVIVGFDGIVVSKCDTELVIIAMNGESVLK